MNMGTSTVCRIRPLLGDDAVLVKLPRTTGDKMRLPVMLTLREARDLRDQLTEELAESGEEKGGTSCG